MKLNVFVAKNLYLGCTGQPIFDDHTAEAFQKGLERQLMTCDEEKAFVHENTVWYHLGSYDDETMKADFLSEPVLLVRCSDVLSQRRIKSKLIEEAKKKEGELDDKVN